MSGAKQSRHARAGVTLGSTDGTSGAGRARGRTSEWPPERRIYRPTADSKPGLTNSSY